MGEIQGIRDAALRRILRERYGEARFYADLAARVLDEDTVPVDASVSGGRHLRRTLIEDREGRRYLVATDGSTRRVHGMRVPSSCRTCKEAQDLLSGRPDARRIVEA